MGDRETAVMMAGADGAEHAVVEYHKLSMIANTHERTYAKLWQQGIIKQCYYSSMTYQE